MLVLFPITQVIRKYQAQGLCVAIHYRNRFINKSFRKRSEYIPNLKGSETDTETVKYSSNSVQIQYKFQISETVKYSPGLLFVGFVPHLPSIIIISQI